MARGGKGTTTMTTAAVAPPGGPVRHVSAPPARPPRAERATRAPSSAPAPQRIPDDLEADAADLARAGHPESNAPPMESIEGFADLIVRDSETEISLPLIQGAMVVYTGSGRRFSMPMCGAIHQEYFEDAPAVTDAEGTIITPARGTTAKTPMGPEVSISTYDFSTHDNRGRLIQIHMLGRFMDVDSSEGTRRLAVPQELQNKPWSLVEHPEHLRQFHRTRERGTRNKIFELLIPSRRDKARFVQYMAEKERQIGRERAEEEYTLSGPK